MLLLAPHVREVCTSYNTSRSTRGERTSEEPSFKTPEPERKIQLVVTLKKQMTPTHWQFVTSLIPHRERHCHWNYSITFSRNSSFRPLGLRVCKVKIQKASRNFKTQLWSPPLAGAGTCSIPQKQRDVTSCFNWFKCVAIGKSGACRLIALLCLPILCFNFLLVLPTYASPHGQRNI